MTLHRLTHMHEFMQKLLDLRSESGRLSHELAAKYKIAVSEPPIEALQMCFNDITFAAELTSHYMVAWARIPIVGLTQEQITKKRGENTERLVALSKTMFVWSLSSAEYSAKCIIAKYPAVLNIKKKPNRRLYLADIVAASRDAGLISADQRVLWLGANTIRNRVVHNNGYGEGDGRWKYAEDHTIVMEDKKMIQGTIMTFPRLTEWLVKQYADWSDRFLTKALPRQ